MTKEEDDLYADLYNDDLGPVGDTSAGDDSIYGEEVKPKGISIQGSSNAAASSGKSSFIPAAKPTQSTGSSFIPSDPSRASGGGDGACSSSAAGRSFIPSTNTSTTRTATPPVNASRIETAPSTNTDTGSKSYSSYPTGGDQGYKQVQPHEMPDEG
jgi:hypothetical protein